MEVLEGVVGLFSSGFDQNWLRAFENTCICVVLQSDGLREIDSEAELLGRALALLLFVFVENLEQLFERLGRNLQDILVDKRWVFGYARIYESLSDITADMGLLNGL